MRFCHRALIWPLFLSISKGWLHKDADSFLPGSRYVVRVAQKLKVNKDRNLRKHLIWPFKRFPHMLKKGQKCRKIGLSSALLDNFEKPYLFLLIIGMKNEILYTWLSKIEQHERNENRVFDGKKKIFHVWRKLTLKCEFYVNAFIIRIGQCKPKTF